VLLTRQIASEEQIENASPAKRCKILPGYRRVIAKLNSQWCVNRLMTLPDQSVMNGRSGGN